jgi:hypothetical protein
VHQVRCPAAIFGRVPKLHASEGRQLAADGPGCFADASRLSSVPTGDLDATSAPAAAGSTSASDICAGAKPEHAHPRDVDARDTASVCERREALSDSEPSDAHFAGLGTDFSDDRGGSGASRTGVEKTGGVLR